MTSRRFVLTAMLLMTPLAVWAQGAVAPEPPPPPPTAQTASTILVMVAEQQIGQEYLVYWWSIFAGGAEFKAQQTSLGIVESVLNDRLRAAGFSLVDIVAKSGSVKLDSAYGIVDLSDPSVRTVGQAFGADIVIIGKALTRQTGPLAGSSMRNAHANLSARAVKVSTGKVVASGTSSAPGLHVDETTAGTLALQAAAEQLAARFIEQLQAGPIH